MNATGVRVRDKDLTCEIFREKKIKQNRQLPLRVNLRVYEDDLSCLVELSKSKYSCVCMRYDVFQL